MNVILINVGLIGVGPVCDLILEYLEKSSFSLDQPPKVAAMLSKKKTSNYSTSKVFPLDIADYNNSMEFFKGLDVVFFADREGPNGASVTWAHPVIERYDCYCIDSGSDYRLDPNVPLIVPEVNMDQVTFKTRLIASPNCAVTPMAVALWPLHKEASIKRIVVSTYQSVSGWGKAAYDQLWKELRHLVSRGTVNNFNPSIFTRPIALDCIPHIDRFLPNGYTKEEMKIVNELRRIMDLPKLMISATAVRVPVGVGHSMSINVEFEQDLTAKDAREILSDKVKSPGVVVVDGTTKDPYAITVRNEPEELQYPTHADVLRDEWKDEVLIGRIRDDDTVDHGINLWCVSNNLRKGAATNVIQIAQQMFERGIIH